MKIIEKISSHLSKTSSALFYAWASLMGFLTLVFEKISNKPKNPTLATIVLIMIVLAGINEKERK